MDLSQSQQARPGTPILLPARTTFRALSGESVHTDSSSTGLAERAVIANVDAAATIIIGVATFRRPSQLRELLPDLIKQAADLDARVVVVDNDPGGSARDVVTALERVKYVHEPRPGLAAVRNRLLREAGDADLLVFIDDDERPTEGWLAALVGVWRRTGCTAVSGPVRSIFQHPPAQLVSATGVFDRVRRPTGTLLRGSATNNLLLDLHWLRAHGIAFDPEFGESGGEDTMLTHSIVAAGGTIVWCDEAEVIEAVPAERTRLGWVMRRLVRTSNSWARVEIKIGKAQDAYRKTFVATVARVPYLGGRGIAYALLGLVTQDRQRQAIGLRDVCCAFGVGLATVGRVRAEYRRINAA